MPACGGFTGFTGLQVLLGAGWNALNSPAPRIHAQSESQQRHAAALETEWELVSDCCVSVFITEDTSAL
jgi:hypothetical protein